MQSTKTITVFSADDRVSIKLLS